MCTPTLTHCPFYVDEYIKYDQMEISMCEIDEIKIWEQLTKVPVLFIIWPILFSKLDFSWVLNFQ